MGESRELSRDHEASCKACQIRNTCKICIDSESHEACQVCESQLDQCLRGLFEGPNCFRDPPPSQQSRDALTAHCSTLWGAVYPFGPDMNYFPSIYLKHIQGAEPGTVVYFSDRAAVSLNPFTCWVA